MATNEYLERAEDYIAQAPVRDKATAFALMAIAKELQRMNARADTTWHGGPM